MEDWIVRLTEAEIEAAKTANGGWTRAQLAEWGVPWPPPSGWKKRLLGEEDEAPVVADDAYILAVAREVTKRGGVLQCAEAQPVDDTFIGGGFRVTVSLSATVTVPFQQDIAHGRRMALEALMAAGQ